MTVFFDTSAVVALHVDSPARKVAVTALHDATVVSALALTEALALVTRLTDEPVLQADLEDAIHDYLLHHNADPKPFVWTKSAEVILKKERRALDALEAIKGNQTSESEH